MQSKVRFVLVCKPCNMEIDGNWTYNEALAIKVDHNKMMHRGHVVARIEHRENK